MGVRSFRAFVAGSLVAVAVVAAGPRAAAAGACGPGVTEHTYDLRTGSVGGVAIATGAPDTDWLVGGAATQGTPAVSDYVVPGADRSWITLAMSPIGTTRVRYTMNAPSGGTILGFTLRYAADNGVTFELNGDPLGGYPAPASAVDHSGFNTERALNVTSRRALVGANVLDALVDNTGGPLALLVGGTVTICVANAVCTATGVLVRANGSDVVRHETTAFAAAPPIARPAGPAPAEPVPANVTTDALTDGTYFVPGVATVTVRGGFARCAPGLTYAAVYGYAGAADVTVTTPLTTPPTTIQVRGLAEEAEVSYDGVTTGTASFCRLGEISVNGGPFLQMCPAPLHLAVPPYVTVRAHDDGPVSPTAADGFAHARRIALYVLVDGPGTADVEVLVGYVDAALVPPTPPV